MSTPAPAGLDSPTTVMVTVSWFAGVPTVSLSPTTKPFTPRTLILVAPAFALTDSVVRFACVPTRVTVTVSIPWPTVSMSNLISVGAEIRKDIDTVGHGIETVTVTRVGTQANRTTLSVNANAGATNIKVRGANGFVVGDKLTVGTPANQETITITAVGESSPAGAAV